MANLKFQFLFFCFALLDLTQFTFLKQRCTRSQGRAGITDGVGQGLADVGPLKSALACFYRVGEPEKLPVWDDTVKH